MKADLHVHTYHSGYASHLHFLRARDSYSDPFEVYRVAKARGMDLVCFTDHDSLDGCLEFLDRRPDAPDFIMGEEIECQFPVGRRARHDGGLKVHLGAIGMTEQVHRDVQPLRDNVFDAVAYLRQEGVFVALNHLFFFFDDQVPLADYVWPLLAACDAAETRNGAMLGAHNELVERLLRDGEPLRLARVGGSDAHTLTRVGRTYTVVDANSRAEFLANLRRGRATTGGAHGSTGALAREIYETILHYWASLVRLRRDDLGARRRLLGMAASLGLLPFQFVPGLVAIRGKRAEAARVARYARALGLNRASPAGATPSTFVPCEREEETR